jgi:hypothetical protein
MSWGKISLKDGIYNPTHYMGSMINDMEGGYAGVANGFAVIYSSSVMTHQPSDLVYST